MIRLGAAILKKNMGADGMPEYIEKGNALCLLGNLAKEPAYQHDGEDYYVGICEASGVINEIQPVDVAPVRHGQWIETPRLYYGAKQYECSLCYSDTFWNKHCITEKYPHCPNCGAIMDL